MFHRWSHHYIRTIRWHDCTNHDYYIIHRRDKLVLKKRKSFDTKCCQNIGCLYFHRNLRSSYRSIGKFPDCKDHCLNNHFRTWQFLRMMNRCIHHSNHKTHSEYYMYHAHCKCHSHFQYSIDLKPIYATTILKCNITVNYIDTHLQRILAGRGTFPHYKLHWNYIIHLQGMIFWLLHQQTWSIQIYYTWLLHQEWLQLNKYIHLAKYRLQALYLGSSSMEYIGHTLAQTNQFYKYIHQAEYEIIDVVLLCNVCPLTYEHMALVKLHPWAHMGSLHSTPCQPSLQ